MKWLSIGLFSIALFCANTIVEVREAFSQPRYVVQNETIKDNKTGLIWHKRGFSVASLFDKMCPGWRDDVKCTTNTETIDDFFATLEVEGVRGWRLPTSQEVGNFLSDFMDAHGGTRRVLLYITAAEDKTKVTEYVNDAHEYIEYIFNEPWPPKQSAPHIVVPVSGRRRQ